MIKDYGHTIENTVKPMFIIFGSFGLLFPVIIVIGHFAGGGSLTQLLQMSLKNLLWMPFISCCIILFGFVCTFFSIRVEGNYIRQMFLKKYILREAEISNLVSVEISQKVTLHFRDGSKLSPIFGGSKIYAELAYDLEAITKRTLVNEE
jgi:hypothetical protein